MLALERLPPSPEPTGTKHRQNICAAFFVIEDVSVSNVWLNPKRTSFALPVEAWATPCRGNEAHVDDAKQVERCLRGDSQAWEHMVRAHSRRIYNLCLRFTGRPQEAEDITQEVFVRVYRNLNTYRADSGSLATWMTTLARNLLIDHYRRSAADRRTDSLEVESGPAHTLAARTQTADQQVWRRELREQVQAALSRLSPELREAVILRDLQDMDYSEIAEVLRIPLGTVKSRINRGRIELARTLESLMGRTESTGGTSDSRTNRSNWT